MLDPGYFHPLENALKDRQIVGADERELLEQRVFGVQPREQLGHHPGDSGADLEEVMSEPDLVEHLLNVAVSGKPVAFEGRSDRCPEQQIGGNRGVGVIALRVETLDEMSKIAGFETLGKHPARIEDPSRRVRLAIRIEPATQAEEVYVFFEVDETQDLDHAQLQLGRVGHACLLVIYPV